jgi:hypothetical protein
MASHMPAAGARRDAGQATVSSNQARKRRLTAAPVMTGLITSPKRAKVPGPW